MSEARKALEVLSGGRTQRLFSEQSSFRGFIYIYGEEWGLPATLIIRLTTTKSEFTFKIQ